MPAVSIIVPVYKVETFLPGCIESILNQEYKDYELLLIDDGSPDRSGSICDQYAVKDSRIKVLHQKNSGAAAARNAGIDISKGRYIAFCDGDDMVSAKWLKRLVEGANISQLVVGAYSTVKEKIGEEKEIGLVPGKLYNNKDYYYFHKAGIAGFLWNALYHKDIIDKLNLRFREKRDVGDYNEDLLFAISYVRGIDTILYTGYSDYYYNNHADSLSNRYQQQYFDKYIEKYNLWEAFICDFFPGRKDMLGELSSKILFSLLNVLQNTNSIKELKKYINSEGLQKCLSLADTSKENHLEIEMIRRKQLMRLYCFYKGIKIKERISL